MGDAKTRAALRVLALKAGEGESGAGGGAVPSPIPVSPCAHNASDFVFNAPVKANVNTNIRIPISPNDINDMRGKLLRQDRSFNRFLSTAKVSVDTKTTLSEWHLAYQTAFNSVLSGYLQTVEQLMTLDNCQSTIIKSCAGITRNCVASVKEVSEKIIKEQSAPVTFANKVKSIPKVQLPYGPTVQVSKTSTFIVAPIASENDKFATSVITKNALFKAVNPADVNMKVDRVTRAGSNEIRIEASSVDLDKLRSLDSLSKAGLHIKEDTKFNPRLLVFGVPSGMNKENIREDIIKLNLDGVDNPDIKVVYVFPPFQNSLTSKCVIEVPPDTRNKLLKNSKIYLGYSSCFFKDHVRIKHCYKCLSFGHLANENKCNDTHCGHCSMDHEMRNCPSKHQAACCYNCKSNKLTNMAHSALDGKKCPILSKRLKDKVHKTNYG